MHPHPHVNRTRNHGRHREMVMKRDRGVCHLCGNPHADAIDHIVPVAWGGSDDPTNLAPAHTSCNSAKRDARPDEWTWSRPSMWLDGYGPNAGSGSPGAAQSSASSGNAKSFGCAGALLWVVGVVWGTGAAIAGAVPGWVLFLAWFWPGVLALLMWLGSVALRVATWFNRSYTQTPATPEPTVDADRLAEARSVIIQGVQELTAELDDAPPEWWPRAASAINTTDQALDDLVAAGAMTAEEAEGWRSRMDPYRTR